MPPTHLSLFTGIGGIDLAAEWAGFQTIGQVENNPFCLRVLEKHWPNVRRWRGIHDFDGSVCGYVDLVSGGFPCGPFSTAGKRLGAHSPEYLWPEMLRAVRSVKPAWVLGENVAGFIGMALDRVRTDLETEGYEVWPVVLPAGGVGAWHKRERCFVVAHLAGERRGAWGEGRSLADGARQPQPVRAIRAERPGHGPAWWSTEPGMGRVVHGIPPAVDRLRALGNAVVPQQVYPILREIYNLIAAENHSRVG